MPNPRIHNIPWCSPSRIFEKWIRLILSDLTWVCVLPRPKKPLIHFRFTNFILLFLETPRPHLRPEIKKWLQSLTCDYIDIKANINIDIPHFKQRGYGENQPHPAVAFLSVFRRSRNFKWNKNISWKIKDKE